MFKDKPAITAEKNRLIGLIDAARAAEDKSAPLTKERVQKEYIDKVAPDAGKMDDAAAQSYVSELETGAPLRADGAFATLVKDAKVADKKADFASKVLDKLGKDKPAGTTPEEKFNNLFKSGKANVVVKAVIRFRLDEDTEYLKNAKAEIKKKEKDGDLELAISLYPKDKSGEYTKEAL